jgi:hypothetical protein
MQALIVQQNAVEQFVKSLRDLDKELDARHALWRTQWVNENRAAQGAKDAAVKAQILQKRTGRI